MGILSWIVCVGLNPNHTCSCEREAERDILEEALHVAMEAEAEVMQPQKGNASCHQKLQEARSRFSLEPPRERGPTNTLILTQ